MKSRRFIYSAQCFVVIAVSAFFGYRGIKWLLYYVLGDGSSAVDMQWSGIRVYLNGINPYWLVHEEGGRGETFIMAQTPSYLHFIYPLFAPIGTFSLDIAKRVFNALSFSGYVFSIILLCRALKQGRLRTVLLCCLFLGLPGFGHCLNNGQLSVFLLTTLIIGTYLTKISSQKNDRTKILGPAIFGLSYCKWGYMPVFSTFLLFSTNKRSLLYSFIPMILGILSFIHLEPLDLFTIFGPLINISKSWAWGLVDVGMTDFQSFVEAAFYWRPDSNNPVSPVSTVMSYMPHLCVVFAASITALCCARLFKKADIWFKLSLSILLNLLLIKHLPYDNILLVVPIIYILSQINLLSRKGYFLMASSSWFWLYPYWYKWDPAGLSMQLLESSGILIGAISIISILFMLIETNKLEEQSRI